MRNAFRHREAVLVSVVREVIKEAGEKSGLLVKDEFASVVIDAVLKSSADNIPVILSEQGLKNVIFAALDASASNIRLIEMKDSYKKVLEGVAKTLDKGDYRDILQGKNLEKIFVEAIGAAAKNIPFFVEKGEGKIIAVVLDKVLSVARNDPTRLLEGDELVDFVKRILHNVSTNQDVADKIVIGDIPLGQLLNQILAIISAEESLRARINGPRLVEILDGIVIILLKGGFTLPPDNDSIKEVVAKSLES